MTPKRARELECSQAQLSPEEIAQGFHYCIEFDGMLCHPEFEEAKTCGCTVKVFVPLKDCFEQDKPEFMVKLSEKELDLVSQALELAKSEIHNRIATCPDIDEYADDIALLQSQGFDIEDLRKRFTR